MTMQDLVGTIASLTILIIGGIFAVLMIKLMLALFG